MALIPLKITQLLAMRSISTSPIGSIPPVTRSCSCPQETPLKDPSGKTCPKPKKSSKLWRLCTFGAKTGITGGLVYWSYRQGMWSNNERSEVLMERLKAAASVLVYGSSACNSEMEGGCCENCKDENEVLQRLKTAYCFLKLDNTVKPIVEDAIYVGTLGDDDDFCRCEICEPVQFLRNDTTTGGPEPNPSDQPNCSSAEPEQTEEPTRGEWIWNKWSSQNWSPKTCIFSKQCSCGDKMEGAVAIPDSEDAPPPEEDTKNYIDEYFIIKKDEDKNRKKSSGKKSESGAGKEGEEGGAEDGGANEGGEDDGGAGDEEEPEDEEEAEEEAAE